MTYFLIGMMIPVHCVLIPLFIQFSKIGLSNTCLLYTSINGSCAEGFADKVGVFAFPAVTGGNPDANLSLIHISRKSAMQESLIRLSLVWQQREWTLRKRTGSRSLKRRFRKRPSKLIPGHLKPDMHLDRTGQLTLGMPVSYTHLDVYKRQPLQHYAS